MLHRDSSMRYRMHVVDDHGDRTRDVIEAREGTVSRTILRDGQPLSPSEDTAERDRLTGMLNSAQSFDHHRKQDAEEKKLATDLIALMPQAMVYSYVPGQPQAEISASQTPAAVSSPAGTSGSEPRLRQVVLDYKPNPDWKPPTTAAEALTGLEGRIWIDPRSSQLVRVEATVFRGVNLGWGMLAHIYPGGRLVLEQADAGHQRWIYTHFTEEATVRALMVKTVRVHTTIDASSFHLFPEALTYQDAIRLLLQQSNPAP